MCFSYLRHYLFLIWHDASSLFHTLGSLFDTLYLPYFTHWVFLIWHHSVFLIWYAVSSLFDTLCLPYFAHWVLLFVHTESYYSDWQSLNHSNWLSLTTTTSGVLVLELNESNYCDMLHSYNSDTLLPFLFLPSSYVLAVYNYSRINTLICSDTLQYALFCYT